MTVSKGKLSKVDFKLKLLVLVFLILFVLFPQFLSFGETNIGIPDINVSISSENGDVQVANSIQILLMLTVLSLAPSILMMMTCFTRVIIILGFIRRALSLQSTPPNQILVGLALFLTFYIMSPVFTDVYENAYLPMQEGTITLEEAVNVAKEPFKAFMLRQVRTKDLALFLDIADVDNVTTNEDIPMTALIPAFIISELKLSFEIGFLIFIPFIVVDMIVASTLMALGMMMLPPVMISLPIKILLFIMVDGWHLIIEKIILSVR
ncbi:flagellar type III secretion system pore protein FliP [Fusibacter sp. 3D3]|uniref:flagellar type III secretion system pore protein FliP n=1 Tax=Fusibacter sp. 3D3 TaxID=1048380 RepID=UPI0008572FA6|nr:flagellar type III secretion system pore protein FliP [Fusibacter sp. 3D3]GAU79861.1 flagellar biosynthesis protein FliP [Fusibacter sp. 3D3]